MRVIPVLDILEGTVVRGVAGRREAYRPVEGCLADSADPVTIARAFRDTFQFRELYLADLDAILHGRRNRALYRCLAEDGFQILVDAGLRDNASVAELFDDGVSAVIVGLETASGPQQLDDLSARCDPEKLVFSLDLMDGRPLGDASAWQSSDPLEIAAQAVDAGLRRMIVLDLSRVGIDAGVGTLALVRRLAKSRPGLRVITGGGVRGIDDLQLLSREPIEGALVASAFHSGAIGPEDVASLRAGETNT